MPISRRNLIKGGLVLGTLGGISWLKPSDVGTNHSTYFQSLSRALHQASITRPTLIIDKQRLLDNMTTLKQHIGQQYAYRIVVKSLPSLALLALIAKETDTRRFMLFDERFVTLLLQRHPDSDVLLGKPLPVASADKLLADPTVPSNKIRWLVDSMERLHDYRNIATKHQQTLQINLEIDIGLHRGGFQTQEKLIEALQVIKQTPLLNFDGFMGYEPHVVKLPGSPQKHLDKALHNYQQHIETARSILGEKFPKEPVMNTAGSTTYQLHTQLNQSPCNELSAGSCLIKPTDFDLPSLADHNPACFIASPVLKVLPKTQIPGVPGLGDVMAWWNPNRQQSLFTYGGNWKALPVSPEGLSYNALYGRSSNQEMLNASTSIKLQRDDWVFLRPTQSESVLLQFGAIAVYEDEQIIDYWPVLS